MSAAIIGSVMGFFLIMMIIFLSIDFCLFKRRKMIIAERRNARKRDRCKGRPAPFLTHHSSSATQNATNLTRWQVGQPSPSNGHLANELLPPPAGRNGLLEQFRRRTKAYASASIRLYCSLPKQRTILPTLIGSAHPVLLNF